MSSNEDIDTNPARQQHSTENHFVDQHQELCRRLCVIADWVILLLQSTVMTIIAKRISHFAQAAWLPGHMTDTNGIAAMLNMELRGAEGLVTRNHTPAKQPGQTRLFKLGDVADNWTPPGIDSGKGSTGVAQPETQRKRKGKTQ